MNKDVMIVVVDGINRFPCDIEAESKQGHGIGFIPEFLSDTSDVYD